jgi:hypothetical protein
MIAGRQPRFLVVTDAWVQDYLSISDKVAVPGQAVPKVRELTQRDVDARQFFGALFAGRLPYRLVHRSRFAGPAVPSVEAYESLKQSVYMFERVP